MIRFLLGVVLLSSLGCPSTRTSIPKLDAKISIDGRLQESFWSDAYAVTTFKNLLDTTANLNPNTTALLIAYTQEALLLGGVIYYEELPVSTMTTRDTTLYLEHCFEVFFDPGADGINYYELEINPIGTIWDLKLVDTEGQINAPENILPWDLPLKQVSTFIDKSSRYWSFEVAIPWGHIEEGRPAKSDDHWSFNAMRIDYESSHQPSFWVWQRTGTRNIHEPSRWVKLAFD